MANISVDCPYCMSKSTFFEIKVFSPTANGSGTPVPHRASHWGLAICASCAQPVVAWFSVSAAGEERSYNWSPLSPEIGGKSVGNINKYSSRDLHYRCSLLGITPGNSKSACPANCPEPVERAFKDAEKARDAGAFSLAAGGFRKTVDRAITPLVDANFKDKMLGAKLGNLTKQKHLPRSMLDWIQMVKDDGNFAMHDDDRDFDTAEEIEPAREFTITLLNYLFTLPQMVTDTKALAASKQATT